MDVGDGRPAIGGDSTGREDLVVAGRIEFANGRRYVEKSDFRRRRNSVGDPGLFKDTIGSPVASNDCGDVSSVTQLLIRAIGVRPILSDFPVPIGTKILSRLLKVGVEEITILDVDPCVRQCHHLACSVQPNVRQWSLALHAPLDHPIGIDVGGAEICREFQPAHVLPHGQARNERPDAGALPGFGRRRVVHHSQSGKVAGVAVVGAGPDRPPQAGAEHLVAPLRPGLDQRPPPVLGPGRFHSPVRSGGRAGPVDLFGDAGRLVALLGRERRHDVRRIAGLEGGELVEAEASRAEDDVRRGTVEAQGIAVRKAVQDAAAALVVVVAVIFLAIRFVPIAVAQEQIQNRTLPPSLPLGVTNFDGFPISISITATNATAGTAPTGTGTAHQASKSTSRPLPLPPLDLVPALPGLLQQQLDGPRQELHGHRQRLDGTSVEAQVLRHDPVDQTVRAHHIGSVVQGPEGDVAMDPSISSLGGGGGYGPDGRSDGIAEDAAAAESR
mmetsp:Transcript_2467/g.4191  ORF Transcript_2467/g.4191 Transcript_2467/m.4191 type:complete len:499 (+) Transcript_2467:593-2089(+)